MSGDEHAGVDRLSMRHPASSFLERECRQDGAALAANSVSVASPLMPLQGVSAMMWRLAPAQQQQGLLALQQVAGNQAVGRMLAREVPVVSRIEAVQRRPRSQSELNREASRLGERQGRRRIFWNSIEGIPWSLQKMLRWSDEWFWKLHELDLSWDDETGYFRNNYVEDEERAVLLDPVASRIYQRAYSDVMNNQPPPTKSWFDEAVGWVCNHTDPCKGNMEQFHADLDSGMSRDEALARGLNRLGGEVVIALIPTEGPRGPIRIGIDATSHPLGPVPEFVGGDRVREPTGGPSVEGTADVRGKQDGSQMAGSRDRGGGGAKPSTAADKPGTVPGNAKTKAAVETKPKPKGKSAEDFEQEWDDPRDDLPAKERISDANKVELEDSAWLRKELPVAARRRQFMDWLKQNHKQGEPHDHINPYPRSLEAMRKLKQFREEHPY